MSTIVIGAAPPIGFGRDDCTVLPDAVAVHFDSGTETWTVRAADGTLATASVVVDARPSDNPAVASHGVPNYFRLPGPDTRRQGRYVARCLKLFERSGAARIEAKGRIVLRMRTPQPVASRFYLTGPQPGPDDLYDGPAGIALGDNEFAGRARLTGHLDAVDGRYHWQGTVSASLPEGVRGTALTLIVEGRSAPARVVEQTPWGSYMVTGVGAPPFDW